MPGIAKRKTLILLGLIILITMIIASNLPQLEFQPGMPLPRLQPGKLLVVPTEPHQFVSISIAKFVLVLSALILTGTALYVTYRLLRGANWRLIFDSLRYAVIISMGVIALVILIMLLPAPNSYPSVEIPVQTPSPPVTSPLGSAPPLLLWLVGIGLVVASVLVVTWVISSSRPSSQIDLIGLEATKARRALATGVSLKDVIINCYIQMSLIAKQEKGIERKDFMTTGEFEMLLEAAGIPHEPIHQLTRLFEAVRYGNWQPNTRDEQMAIQCLEAIMGQSPEAEAMN